MKKTVTTTLLSLSLLAPALALAAGNCEPKNAQMSTMQRTAYVKQCLAESSKPANVKRVAEQHKQMSCEQNAKNFALQGAAKTSYVTKCMNQNDARDAALSHKLHGTLEHSYASEG
ncbi:MAG TPA: hypothetical protein VIU93_03410 [Gallionellaceae bacterium]